MTGAAPSVARDAAAKNRKKNNRLKLTAAISSVCVATALIVAKATAWMATGSVSLLSTLIDSVLDLLASAVNLLAVRQAEQPADREHRFGHGKAEPLAGLAQSAFVAGSAVFLLFEVGERLVNPQPIVNTDVGYAVMAFSIALTFGLVMFQRFVIRRTGSVAISADSLHYRADLLTNVGVIVALFLADRFSFGLADPIIAVGIAAYIAHGAWGIFVRSLDMLMDRELPDADRQRIRQIATAHPGVIDLHDLRTRSSGTSQFIQFHLEMDGELSLIDAHLIADQVMQEVERAFPGAEVLIHEDPHGVPERRATFE